MGMGTDPRGPKIEVPRRKNARPSLHSRRETDLIGGFRSLLMAFFRQRKCILLLGCIWFQSELNWVFQSLEENNFSWKN